MNNRFVFCYVSYGVYLSGGLLLRPDLVLVGVVVVGAVVVVVVVVALLLLVVVVSPVAAGPRGWLPGG